MPYVREFFHEKFQVPIEFFNPLQNVTVAESAPMQDVARSAHLLGELVGLALRNVTVSAMGLNLRPATVVRRQDLEKRRLFFVAQPRGFCRPCRAGRLTTRAARRLRIKRQRRYARRTTPCARPGAVGQA